MASTITWPEALPRLDQVADSTPDTRLRTQTDVGPAKVRNRYTYAPRTITGRLLLTGDQRRAFQSFYIVTLKSGSLSFIWDDPIDDSLAEVRFVSVGASQQVRSGDPSHRLWTVSVAVEVLDAA